MYSRNIYVCGYSPDKLANARICETEYSGIYELILCPHCGEKQDRIVRPEHKILNRILSDERIRMTGTERKCCPHCGGVFLDSGRHEYILCPHCGKKQNRIVRPEHAILNRFLSDERKKMTGSELKCCPSCGGVFLDPRFREKAIGGGYGRKKRVSETHRGILLRSLMVPILFISFYSVFSKDFIQTVLRNGLYAGLELDIVLFTSAVMMAAAYWHLKKKMVGDNLPDNELDSSRTRLKNPDYLRALERLGRGLPVRYLNEINAMPDDRRIFRVLSGQCEYCGFLLTDSAARHRFGRSVTVCPQCRMPVYDNRVCELAAYPPAMRHKKYDDIARDIKSQLASERIFSFKFGIAASAVVLVLGILMFLTPFVLQVPEWLSHLLSEISAFPLLFGGIGCYVFLLEYVRYRQMNCGVFERELMESERRLRDSDYAWKARKAVSFYESDESSYLKGKDPERHI